MDDGALGKDGMPFLSRIRSTGHFAAGGILQFNREIYYFGPAASWR